MKNYLIKIKIIDIDNSYTNNIIKNSKQKDEKNIDMLIINLYFYIIIIIYIY